MLNLKIVRLIYSETGYEPAKTKENRKINPLKLNQLSIDEYVRVLKKHGRMQRINLIKNCNLCTATITRVTKQLELERVINVERIRKGKQIECFISLKCKNSNIKINKD